MVFSRWEHRDGAGRASHLTAVRERRDFDLGDHRTDVRGWTVQASDGHLVGTVDRLMVESFTGKIRYAAVALIAADKRAAGSVLVPVGVLQVQRDRAAVVLDYLTGEQLDRAPRLHDRPVTRDHEDATLSAYGMATSREVGDFLYAGPNFDERRLHRLEPNG